MSQVASAVLRLDAALRAAAVPAQAPAMRSYMKNKFNYFGIKSEPRRRAARTALEQFDAPLFSAELNQLCRDLFAKPEREFHYCAVDLFAERVKRGDKLPKPSAAQLNEMKAILLHMTVPKNVPAHWDVVDLLARSWHSFLRWCGPARASAEIDSLFELREMWIDRVLIIHQNGIANRDTALLTAMINRALGRAWPATLNADSPLVVARQEQKNEFFIAKAIGWALRDLARADAPFVRKFVTENSLPPLSVREALKHIGSGSASTKAISSSQRSAPPKKRRKKADDDDDDNDDDDDE
jgi:3-methyladenine DNA glycosylase AlkD